VIIDPSARIAMEALMVDLNVLQTFLAVIDAGSVTAAARQRGYSVATVSRQMSALQRRYGITFFEPCGRSIKPTPEAFELAALARPLAGEAARFDRFSHQFRRRRSPAARAVSIVSE
jgi:DNA-binding transcriptional LysR family regulator